MKPPDWPGPDVPRPIAALWSRFEALARRTPASETELEQCRVFFFAGAADLYDWLTETTDAHSEGPDPLEGLNKTSEVFQRIEAEIEVFRSDPEHGPQLQ
jgi:hypothetical protein